MVFSQNNTNYGTSAGSGGSENSSFGGSAGDKVTGIRNVFLGYASGYNFNSGNYNLYAGYYSGYNSSNGSYNVFLGPRAGYSSDGSSNTFIGYASGYKNDGNSNLFAGMDAGYNGTTGSNNVFLGFRSGYLATGSNNLFLGYQAGYNETGSEKLYIDNSSTATPLIWGDFSSDILTVNGNLGVGTNTPSEKLHINGNLLTSGWLNIQNDYGLKNTGDNNHFFSNSDSYWKMQSRNGLEIADNSGSRRAVLYHNGSSFGFLDQSEHWALEIANDNYTAFRIDNDEKMRINDNGRVGIGTTNPTADLQVIGNIAATGNISMSTANTDKVFIAEGEINTNQNLYVQSSGATAVTVLNSNRNVGIGTINPSEKLHVNGNLLTTGWLNLQNDNGLKNVADNNHFFSNSDSYWKMQSRNGLEIANNDGNRKAVLYHNGSSFGFLDQSEHWALEIANDNYTAFRIDNDEKMRIDADGHIGIGTDSPTHELEVIGNAKISGNLTLGGDLVHGAGIDPDPQAPKLLALDTYNKMVYHNLNDIRNPWGLRFVQNALGTGLSCIDFTDTLGLTVEVDVLDIHGNILLGNNGYIDDRDHELAAEDQIWAGEHGGVGERDDWIHIAERIELSSNSDVGEGVVIFGKNTISNQYLNLTQDGPNSYLANSTGLSEYFLKATGRDTEFGGSVKIGDLDEGTTSDDLVVSSGGLLKTISMVSLNPWTIHSGVSPYLSYTNKVGINTSSMPTADLEVNGSGKFSSLEVVGNGDATEWNEAYTSRVIAGSGLTWNSTSKMLDVNSNLLDRHWELIDEVVVSDRNVEIDGNFDASTISTGSLSITGLVSGTWFDRVLMEDGSGNLGYKDLSSFNFSHWNKDAGDNLKYESGTITSTKGIYAEVGTSDLALVVKNGSTTNFKVDGAGNIRGRKLELDLQTSWPDFVFKEAYELRSLEEVETYVKTNHHLPDVPSEKEVRENGIDVAEMESVLLQKIEELTLYIIEQNKTIKGQQEELKQQKNDFAARLEALEQKIGQ